MIEAVADEGADDETANNSVAVVADNGADHNSECDAKSDTHTLIVAGGKGDGQLFFAFGRRGGRATTGFGWGDCWWFWRFGFSFF